ncbi:little elongation complex subunit 1 isoform X2 [Drosophila obscura]|uniref:little elongation complex subunit 1 isoform X2 n=1 Tax=Drosophila obscura TaxID=7282 RepID=UPI001BB21898|nr:little elongation complex subunit 1 isoform X2 [Drosophila obscura]
MAMPENLQFPEINIDHLLGQCAQGGTFLTPQFRHSSIPKSNTNAQSKRRRLSERICDNDELIRKLKQLQGHNQKLTDTQRTAKEVTDLYTKEKQQRIELERQCQELGGRCNELEIKLDAQVTNCENLEEELKVRALPMDAKDLVEAYMQLAHRVGDDAGLPRREQNIMKKVRDYCKSAKIAVPEPKSPNTKAKRKGNQSTMKTQSTQTSTKLATNTCSIGVQVVNLVETRNQGTQHKNTTTTRGTTTASFIKYRDVGTCFPEPKPPPNVRQILDEMLSWHSHDIAKPLSPIMDPLFVVEEDIPIHKTSTTDVGTCTMLCNVHREIDFMPEVPSQLKVSTSRPPSRTMLESVKDETLTGGGNVPAGHNKEFAREILNFLPHNQSCLANLPPQAFDELWQVIGQMVLCLLHRRSNPPQSPPPSINQMDFTSWLYALYEGTLTHPVIEKQLGPEHASSGSSKKDNYESDTDGRGMDVGTDPMDLIAESPNISIRGELTPIHLPPKPPKPPKERKQKSRKRKAASLLKPIPKRKPVELPSHEAPLQVANESMQVHQEVECPAPETAIQFISNLNTFNIPYCDNLDYELDSEERYLLHLTTNGPGIQGTEPRGGETDEDVQLSKGNSDEETSLEQPQPAQEELNENVEHATSETDSWPVECNSQVFTDEDTSPEQLLPIQEELIESEEDATSENHSLPAECNSQFVTDEETSLEQQTKLSENEDVRAPGICGNNMPFFLDDKEDRAEPEQAADPPKLSTAVHTNFNLELFGSESDSEGGATSEEQLPSDSFDFSCSTSEESEDESQLVIEEESCSPTPQSPKSQSPLRSAFSPLKRNERASESPQKEVRLTRLRAKQIEMEQNSLKEQLAKDIDTKGEQTPKQEDERRAERKETKEMEHKTSSCYDLESPASPPSQETNDSDSPPIEIPLELSGCPRGDAEPKAMLMHVLEAPKGRVKGPKHHSQTQLDMLCSTIKRYLTDTMQLDSTCSDFSLEVFKVTQDVAVIVHVMLKTFCQMTYDWTEPQPNDPLDRLLNALRYFEVFRGQSQPSYTQSFLCALEKRLFRLTKERLQWDWSITCVKLYLQMVRLQLSHSNPETYENPSRLLLAKILYHYDKEVPQLAYEVLCCHPTVLPHREEREYNNSDPLITVIKHLLMSRKYDVGEPNGSGRLLLSKLRFEYHFQPFEPTSEQVLENLVSKLKVGHLEQLSYAFALFCRRSTRVDVLNNVLAQHLVPLASSYCDLSAHTDAYDVRLAGILQCISVVVKPLPIETDISGYMGLFKRLLVAVPRPGVQEAAVQAILRLQRFGFKHALDALQNYRPNYQLSPLTRAMMRSFVQRRRVFHFQMKHAQTQPHEAGKRD